MNNNPIIFVHGFKYDPRTFSPDHPEYHTYPRWRAMLPDREVVPFKWFSNPSLWYAWRRGYRNHYRLAWDLAEGASERLVATAMSVQGKVDIVCHSLGSRVVMAALGRCPNVSKVLILNGAEYATTGAAVAIAHPGVKFYNVVVPGDDILNTLARCAPGVGRRFLGNFGVAAPSPSNWTNLFLRDDSLVHTWAVHYDLPRPEANNPNSIGDHWFTFENEDNWPLYQAIFSGEWDEWWKL